MESYTRTKNSTRNIAMGLISKLLNTVLIFINRRFFLQVLSLEYLGISGLFTDVLSMLSLADLGLTTAMAFSFYKPLANNDEDKLAALINYYKKLYTAIAGIIALVGVALVPFLRFIINLENDIPYLELYYLIDLGSVVISYLFVYKATIITADQKNYLVTKYAIWTNMLKSVLQIVLLYITKSYAIYSSVKLLTTLINNLIISHVAGREYPAIKRKVVLPGEERRSIFQNLKSMVIYKLSVVLFSGTDNIIISVVVGTLFVGQYSNYNTAVANLSSFAYIIFNSLTASVGNLIVKESPEKRHRVFRGMSAVSFWISGFFIFCLYFLLDDFVMLWLGPEYIVDTLTKIAILLNFYLTLTSEPIWSFREATGIYQKTKFVMLIAAVCNIFLSIIMGLLWGLGGILLATFISKVATYVWYEPYLLHKEFFQARSRGYFMRQLANFALLFACIAVFQIILTQLSGFQVTRWLELILKGVVCTIFVNAVYLLRYIKTEEFRLVQNKITGLLKNRRR